MNAYTQSRRSRRLALALAASLFFSAAQGLAAQAKAALSLEDCLAQGLDKSRNLAIEATKVAAARARLDSANRQYFPSLVGSGSYAHSSAVDNKISLGQTTLDLSPAQDAFLFRLGLQQPLFTGFRIEAGISQAKAGLDSAKADAAARRRDSASAIEKAWWSLVMAQESYRVVVESAPSIRAHVPEAQKRLDRGLGLRAELLAARMRVDDLEALLTDAGSSLALARARLNLLIGLAWDKDTEVLVPDEIEGPSPLPAVDGLVERAKSARPELLSAAARIASAEAAERLARSALLPSAFLTGSFSYADPNPKAFPPRAGFEPLWDLGLVVSMDLGRIPTALSQAEEARANATQSRLARDQTGEGITLEVVSAWLELSRSSDRLKATSSSVGLAEDALRSQKDRFAAGLSLSTEVSDAEAALLCSKLDRTRSRVAWELARAALRDALGGE